MKIEQTIIDTLSLSVKTKIPILFISNPGLGKSTILKRYAARNGMHLETLIGSRYSPEDITGYQVNNGGECLQHLNPEWFNRVLEKEKEGTSTLLFIDELSTCSEAVQGPLLSLIFDRTIGNEKYLPEDCIIVSAANYSENLSSTMNIISPTLNRFCIINLNDSYSARNLVDEFLDKVDIFYPEKYQELDANENEYIDNRFKDFWLDTFAKYSDKQSPNGYLDISCRKVGEIYSTSEVYNFISGRSLSYLKAFLKAYVGYSMKDKDVLHHIIDGLVGNGTCTFIGLQKKKFREYVYFGMEKIINRENRIRQNLTFTGNLSKDIAAFIVSKDKLETSAEDDMNALVQLSQAVADRFELGKVIANTKEPEEVASFISDYESVIELQQYVSKYPDSQNTAHQISEIAMDYYGLYCDMTGSSPDFQGTFGIDNSLFERVCFLKANGEKNNSNYLRAAKRKSVGNKLASLYLMKPGDCFLEADLHCMISSGEPYKVLVYEDGFKFRKLENYLKDADEAV